MNYFFLSILTAICLGGAFLVAETIASSLLGFIAAIGLVLHTKLPKRIAYRYFFLTSIFVTLIGFYWIPQTLETFGQFNSIISHSLFVLFILVSSIQWLLTCFVYQSFNRKFKDTWHWQFAAAWLVGETLLPRMFPWALSHTQIIWRDFSGLAELFGVEILSALLLWWASLLVAGFSKELSRKILFSALAISLTLLCASNIRSHYLVQLIQQTAGFDAGLIQGNLDPEVKENPQQFRENINRYRELSAQAIEANAQLIIWPETALNIWMPENLTNVRGTQYDPLPAQTVPLLFGVLTYNERKVSELENLIASMYGEVDESYRNYLRHQRYNSAVGLNVAGDLQGVYHKRILMPFGEYLPFGRKFPALARLSPQSGDFDVGQLKEPIQLDILHQDGQVKPVNFSLLVCYEDLLPELGIEAARLDGQVLVNLTNDAWYGDTHAPLEHHLLAQWRAIETRRYLVRATNTGLTGVVDPFGRTQGRLPMFEEGILVSEIKPLDIQTLYTFWGRIPVMMLSFLLLILAVVYKGKIK